MRGGEDGRVGRVVGEATVSDAAAARAHDGTRPFASRQHPVSEHLTAVLGDARYRAYSLA